ncbi:MAG: helix-turn-helix domain-containing protein [Chloroflexi bacterium]|nr:helix-turn-helix domain-containing protein [Chloroflexota bacterium]
MIDAQIQDLLDRLEACADDVGAAMAEAIVRDVAPIGAVARHDRQFKERFIGHCAEHVRVFARTTRDGRAAHRGDLEFVREVGSRRAEDAFPMAALLDGLRVGHRVLSRHIAEISAGDAPAGLWLVRKSLDYMDAASRVLTDSYLARQQMVMGRTELVRRQLLDDLLEGRYAGRADAADIAASMGFEPDEQYCVAVLVPVLSVDAERLAQVLAAEVSRAAFNVTSFRFVVVRRDEVVSILRAPDTTPVVAEALPAFGRRSGVTARAGISTTCRGIAEIPRGYWEAARALHAATTDEPCVDLRRLGLLRYLASSADSVAQRLALQAAGPLVAPGSERSAALADTVLAYVDAGNDATHAAQQLRIHFNSVHNRLERVSALLDRATLTPADLVELAVAIRISRAQR